MSSELLEDEISQGSGGFAEGETRMASAFDEEGADAEVPEDQGCEGAPESGADDGDITGLEFHGVSVGSQRRFGRTQIG